MRKQDILKQHGLTEAEFYKLYPTEEHYKMAMGGSPFVQFAQKGATTKPVFDASKYARAKKVDKPEAGYTLIPGQDPNALKTYYDIQAGSVKPGGPGAKGGDPDKLLQYWKEQVAKGVNPKSVIDNKHLDPKYLGELEKSYNAQYIEKTPTIPPPPKQLDLGIGWAGERREMFGHSMPTFKDSTGKEYNLQQFKVPAQWNPKTKSWDTGSGWNQSTELTGYQQDGKFITIDPSASKLAYEGDKPYYTQEGLKYPSFVQNNEDQKVMKTGPLTISGATAMDVQNSGMNYNSSKDVVAPLNTRGSGTGIDQDQFVEEVGIENLPAGTGMEEMIKAKFKAGGFSMAAPDFFNPEYLMKQGGAPCFECGGMHKQQGGIMSEDLQGQYPIFNQGGVEDMHQMPDGTWMANSAMQYGGNPSVAPISSKDSLNMFRDIIKKKMGGPAYPGETQDSIIESKKNDFLHFIRNNTMDAIAREENDAFQQEQMMNFMQMGGNPYGFNPNMNNQQAFYNAAMQGKEKMQQDMGNFFGATQNLGNTMTPYTQTSVTQMQDGGNPTPWWQRQGYDYFPMNYNPMMKMSKKDVETMQMLAANPNTNLKEFHAKKRLFGPGVRRIDMVFGTKAQQLPEFNAEPHVQYSFQGQAEADKRAQDNKNGVPRAEEIQIDEFKSSRKSPSGMDPLEYMKSQLQKKYGGLPMAEDGIFDPGPNQWGFKGQQQPQFTTPESEGIQQPGINQFQMQDTGAPMVTPKQPDAEQQYKITQKFKNKWDPEAAVNWGLAGTNALASFFEQGQARKNEEKWKSMQGADNQFYSQPAGNRGDYDQFGNLRPDQKVPVQFAGMNAGQMGSNYQFQEGGEYYMTDDEINAIMQAGGEIDFLD